MVNLRSQCFIAIMKLGTTSKRQNIGTNRAHIHYSKFDFEPHSVVEVKYEFHKFHQFRHELTVGIENHRHKVAIRLCVCYVASFSDVFMCHSSFDDELSKRSVGIPRNS